MRGMAADIANIKRKKNLLMQSGFRLFADKGIETITMPEVGQLAGVPRATLYRYYSNKLDLVISVGAWVWNDYIESRQALLTDESRESMTGAELFRMYMDSFMDLYRNHPDILRFNYNFNSYIRNENPSEERKQPYMSAVEGLQKRLHEMYQKGMKDGTLRSDISEEAMLSSSFHIMLAAATRYAVGLIYVPEKANDPESELIMLEELLLQRYIQDGK